MTSLQNAETHKTLTFTPYIHSFLNISFSYCTIFYIVMINH